MNSSIRLFTFLLPLLLVACTTTPSSDRSVNVYLGKECMVSSKDGTTLGTLRKITPEWIVLENPNGEILIDRRNVVSIDFSSNPQKRASYYGLKH